MIKDSGDRTKFESGAVRDMAEGKGRCDLMPLDVIADFYNSEDVKTIFNCLHVMANTDVYTAGHFNAVCALRTFIRLCGIGSTSEFMLEVAIHYEDGAKKYGERNWEKGIPLSSYVDSACRHFLKYLAGWEDERHDRAFAWNILGYMYEFKKQHEKEVE